jgi:benzodiazapine receptor
MVLPSRIVALVGWVALSLGAGFIGSQFAPGSWYAELNKPGWTPPDALFGPVWTILYLLMGIAAWLVWRRSGFVSGAFPLVVFIVQLVLNALWSYIFFGLHRPGLAFFEILFLLVSILITLLLFWRARQLAGVLLLPYLAWVGFATALNYSIWRLNL